MTTKQVVIFGDTKFAELIKYYCDQDSKLDVRCFTVDRAHMRHNHLCGLPVYPFEEIEKLYSQQEVAFVLAIGYRKMNQIRQMVADKIRQKGFQLASLVHPTAVIADNAAIGDGSIIFEGVVVEPFAALGVANIVWCNSSISHHVRMGNYNYVAPGVSISGDVLIGSNCFFGSNSTVKNGVTIDDFALVGASAYVSNEIAKYGVIVPQKSIVLRDKRSLDIFLL